MNVQIIRSNVERSAGWIKSAADHGAKIVFGPPLARIADAVTGGTVLGRPRGSGVRE